MGYGQGQGQGQGARQCVSRSTCGDLLTPELDLVIRWRQSCTKQRLCRCTAQSPQSWLGLCPPIGPAKTSSGKSPAPIPTALSSHATSPAISRPRPRPPPSSPRCRILSPRLTQSTCWHPDHWLAPRASACARPDSSTLSDPRSPAPTPSLLTIESPSSRAPRAMTASTPSP